MGPGPESAQVGQGEVQTELWGSEEGDLTSSRGEGLRGWSMEAEPVVGIIQWGPYCCQTLRWAP